MFLFQPCSQQSQKFVCRKSNIYFAYLINLQKLLTYNFYFTIPSSRLDKRNFIKLPLFTDQWHGMNILKWRHIWNSNK